MGAPGRWTAPRRWCVAPRYQIPDEALERAFLAQLGEAGLITRSAGIQMQVTLVVGHRVRARLFDQLSIQAQVALVPNEDVEIVPGSHLRWDSAEEYAVRIHVGLIHFIPDSL